MTDQNWARLLIGGTGKTYIFEKEGPECIQKLTCSIRVALHRIYYWEAERLILYF
jgi:hypothetical protein